MHKKEIKNEKLAILEKVIRRIGCIAVVFSVLDCCIFIFLHMSIFRSFSSSLVGRNVPSSHVAAKGFFSKDIAAFSLKLSEASIQPRTDRRKFVRR